MASTDLVYSQIIEGLRLVASAYPIQRKSLPDFVNLPDEVLQAVDPVYFTQLLQNNLITTIQYEALQEYDSFLDSYAGPEAYSVLVEELEHGAWFESLRARARVLLGLLDEEYRPPECSSTVYVPSR